MKLVHSELENEIIQEGQSTGFLIIENSVFLLEICRELITQCGADDGRFVLSDRHKPVSIPRNLHFIDSPLRIEHNPRKGITALYKELEIYLAENPLSGEIQSLMERMAEMLNLILPEAKAELAEVEQPSWNSILRFFDVSFRSDYSRMEEDISDYLNLARSYLGFSVFVIYGACHFLNPSALDSLCRQCDYDELSVLFIENYLPEKNKPAGIRALIIDEDLCEIIKV